MEIPERDLTMDYNLKIHKNIQNKTLELKLSGRVTAVNAERIMEEVKKDYKRFTDVVIDAEDLEYISSAGLRQILQIMAVTESKNGRTRLIKANEMVRDVLEMTGLSEDL